MANITKTGPQPIKSATSNASIISGTFTNRKAIDLLPGVHQTETLTKFFDATVNHLIQPEDVEFLSGYIGSKPSYYNANTDFYITEVTKTRQDYQLPVTAVSVDLSSNAVNNVMFYDDLLNQLALQGSNIENPSRLLEGDYYSWSPPIDLDKFLNYYEYYWLPNGPSVIELISQTDVLNEIVGQTNYTYNGRYKRTGDSVELVGELTFISGMRIKVTNDHNYTLNDQLLIVEGVGRSIQIKPDVIFRNPAWDTAGWNIRGWDGDESVNIPDYMTVARLSDNLNRWSVHNRWFHRDVILQAGMSLIDTIGTRAQRPIIEFEQNTQLYNYGTHGRPEVDLVDTTSRDIFTNLVGKNPANVTVDGTTLIDGMRILVTADIDPSVNNRIYQVGGIFEYDAITLTVVADGQNANGSPAYGDTTHSYFGQNNGNTTWWYNGKNWVFAQQFVKYGAPLFSGFDASGINLIDPTFYPGSNFAGTKIFSYAIDSNNPVDSVLQQRIKRDQFGDFVFENLLVTQTYTYISNGQSADIYGYIWYNNNGIANGWYKSNNSTRQYIVNSYTVNSPTTTFLIDQNPATVTNGQLPSLMVYLIENGNSRLLIKDLEYTAAGRIVTLTLPAPADSRVEIKSWSNTIAPGKNGYYEQPLNLVANPNNQQITTVSFNDTLQHFSGIIANQNNDNSTGVGLTKWKDSSQVRGLGTSILQHRSPLLKLMLLNSSNLNTGVLNNISLTDPSLAIQFAQKEYIKFYNRFIRTLLNLYTAYGFDNTTSSAKWIETALAQVNLGKSRASAWAYSGYEIPIDFSATTATPTYVPPTGAKLGIAPVYKPEVYLDEDYYPAKLTIQTHDGARIVMEALDGTQLGTIDQGLKITSNPELLTNPVAAAWLQFELNIYNGLPSTYRDADYPLAFDTRLYRPGKWRNTDYTRAEYLNVIRPSFDKWIIQSQVDYTANVTFSQNNQFTFNYSTSVDREGNAVPGHWRGIYRYFYDTDRPHTHPWEMLGFAQKPAWWITEYGTAPYTRGNGKLWNDIRDGIIRQGTRAGTWAEWARPGILNCIPVDDQGDLLPPILAGTVVSLPGFVDAQEPWKFGDGAPVESVWLTGLDFSYVNALVGYLLKPARFIEQGWDPLRVNTAGETVSEQYYYIDTNRRRSSNEFYVHRENPSVISGSLSVPNESTLTFFGSWGIQHWISEYLVSQNLSVTTYFGSIVRGGYSVLAHKFGGFISTDDSLRLLVDSFGQIGFTSQLIPSENIKTYIYKSTNLGVYFYSGVIVVKQKNGWKVYGYDGIKQTFTIIPSLANGPKTSYVIGNQTVVEYQTGQGISDIPYGTVFKNRQEVYDFLISYGRWLESQGWIFDAVNENSGKIINWKQSARDFVYWSQGNWDNGNFVALSPSAGSAKFKKEFGMIQYVSGTIGGTYPVIDKSGQPIENQNMEVLRQDDVILVRPLNDQTVFGLRLYVTSIEHVILLDNQTQFGDLIYDPLYNIYQPRVKVYGYKTNGWTGRLDAPGYFLNQDTTTGQWSIVPNLDKTAEDFRRLYNIDQPKNVLKIDSNTGEIVESSNSDSAVTRSDLSNLAKHLIGYQPRQYLDNLLLDQTTQFEFYQGFVRQKGTRRALDNILRATNILSEGESLNYYEEFAFRRGRYGSVSLNKNIDFILSQYQFNNNPQRIDVFSNYDSSQTHDGVIEIVPRDSRIVVPPETYEGDLFPVRNNYSTSGFKDLPDSGYVQLGETTYYVVNKTDLLDLSSNYTIQAKQTVWQFITENLTWNVYKVVSPNSNVIGTTPQVSETFTTINFASAHGIVVGDIVVLSDFINNSSLNGTFVVDSVTADSMTIPISTFIEDESGTVLVYRTTRFYDDADLQSTTMLGGWDEGDLAYVDNTDTMGLWKVYKRFLGSWVAIRKADLKINAQLMLSAKLYNRLTFALETQIDYFDPAKGCIPGVADKEITFKNLFDPAQYNQGDSELYNINPNLAWSDNHTGQVWWDLSTTRYVNYEQGDPDYRARNWGKLAPNTTIDIYEWVKSPIPPTEWENYVVGGLNLSQFGLDYMPSGTVRNSGSPAWTQTTEYDVNGNSKTWYYFWVGHSDMSPMVPNRVYTTNELINIVINPDSNNIAWYAAIGPRNLLVSNCYNYLNADNTVMQVVYTNKPNNDNDYKEWTLIRKDDPRSTIDDYYWNKLRDSLTGYDAMGNQVPDPKLNVINRYGTLIRPRQSWFIDRLAALGIWVNRLNTQLATATIPLVEDPEKSTWVDYFNQTEPLPPSIGNWDYEVGSMAELEQLSDALLNGDRVLVPPLEVNNNLWTIWTWDADNNNYNLSRTQSYSVPNYWKYIDWYATGYSSETIPTFTVNTTNEITDIFISGTQTIKVLDYGSRGWALYGSVDGEKKIVGLQDGTIQISDSLWNSEINLDGFDRISFDNHPFDYNPTVEIGIIFDGVKEAIYGGGTSLELNQLFFAMINYVFNEQGYVDWIFKTSFILVSGSAEPLTSSQLYKPNTVDNLLDYINEVKPYRTKIREFISGRSTKDTANIVGYDFDKPAYEGRVLNTNVRNDANILMSDTTYTPWYNNYKTNPNLIRRLKTQLVFDRVSSMPAVAEISNCDSFGSTVRFTVINNAADTFKIGEIVSVSNVVNQGNTFAAFTSNDVVVTYATGNVIIGNYTGNIGIGTGIGGGVFHQAYGAADRIIRSYSPTSYMPKRYAPDLISGTDFKGTIYGGNDFNMEPGWGVAPWDFAAGWDADSAAFDNYLEVILEGGLPPVYDQFYGDGIRKQFRLSKVPQDLLHTKIWRDGVICEYGVDYIVPNWATKIEVALPGTGYQVDEEIELVPDVVDPSAATIRGRINTVNVSGGITSITVTNKGFFTTVQHEPYRVEYAPYQSGVGKDASAQPVWGGDTVVFTDPPLSSYRPNIWILYAGTTFDPAPEGIYDTLTDGGNYVQPTVDPDHAEELYTAKLRDAVRVDTYSQPVGGMPLVMSRTYVTDSLTDHYDLGIRPQNENAVAAYLDSTLLKYGPTADYVINFETGELVFIRPPVSGKVLSTLTIGEGGSGNSVHAVQVVDSGINYTVGDMLFLSGGVPVESQAIPGTYLKTLVMVTQVKCVAIDIIDSGTGYITGDLLILDNDDAPSVNVLSKITLKVETVTSAGEIETVSILDAGAYKQEPTTVVWQTTGKGKDAEISVTWGVSAARVTNQGLYARRPTGTFNHESANPADGTGAAFNALWTSIIDQKTFISNGVTNTFNMDTVIESFEQVMIICNGKMIDPLSINISANLITIPLQDEGVFIVITVFNTSEFSTVVENEFFIGIDSIGDILRTYPLLRTPFSTIPNYNTVTVLINGVIALPPNVNTTVANGSTRQYDLTFIPSDPALVEVWVDQDKQNYGSDYDVVDNQVILNYSPDAGAVVTTAVPDPVQGFTYTIDSASNTITFNSGIDEGYKITLITYSQDLSYKFTIEGFNGREDVSYILNGIPSSESTLLVTVNGFAQRQLWDFALVLRDNNGYDLNPYNIERYDVGVEGVYCVVFNPNITHTVNDKIEIRYMRGRSEKPATAFRQFIAANGAKTSQVISNDSRTVLLNNVFVNTSQIEVADISVLTPPTLYTPGYIWIGNELIEFGEMTPAPTTAYTHRGILSNLYRGSGGTSGDPVHLYDTDFYSGDGSTIYYATSAIVGVVGETVHVNGKTQVGGISTYYLLNGSTVNLSAGGDIVSANSLRVYKFNETDDTYQLLLLNIDYFIQLDNQIRLVVTYPLGTQIKIDLDSYVNIRSNYYVTENPIGQPAGRYVEFDLLSIPPVGNRNIQISRKLQQTNICHVANSIVQDAGTRVVIPGGYNWEPTAQGLQYSKSSMAKFILNHPGAIS